MAIRPFAPCTRSALPWGKERELSRTNPALTAAAAAMCVVEQRCRRRDANVVFAVFSREFLQLLALVARQQRVVEAHIWFHRSLTVSDTVL